jgi:hypothetical protein
VQEYTWNDYGVSKKTDFPAGKAISSFEISAEFLWNHSRITTAFAPHYLRHPAQCQVAGIRFRIYLRNYSSTVDTYLQTYSYRQHVENLTLPVVLKYQVYQVGLWAGQLAARVLDGLGAHADHAWHRQLRVLKGIASRDNVWQEVF